MKARMGVAIRACGRACFRVALAVAMVLGMGSTGSASQVSVEVCFSPGGDAEKAVVGEIDRANRAIDVAVYSLTSGEIASALVRARERGVAVRVVLDKNGQAVEASKTGLLSSGDVWVKTYSGDGLMHNRFAVVDGEAVITGSFDWTAAAEEKNQENLLVIRDTGISDIFKEKFEEYWGGSESGSGQSQANGCGVVVGNLSTKKLHQPGKHGGCRTSVGNMAPKNVVRFGSVEEGVAAGYELCKYCGTEAAG